MCFDYFQFWLFFDFYSLVYLFVLTFIVGSVHFFIWDYMSEELNLFRFLFVLNFFVFFMIILIISPCFFSFILGWDGLGFSSFVLVAWYGCDLSRSSSIKTFLTNRVGDGFLLVSLCMFVSQGHFGFLFFDSFCFMLLFFLILVAFTKSAHFPFSNWLPDAMAAPTPVSALVHSSTLVTAGLFLMFRFSYCYSYDLLSFIHNVGLWTLFIGSFGACVDYNSKKVVAYSTISQLGFISYIMSYGFYDLSFFYIMVHAIFKAMLFISVGDLIGSSFHYQDIRHMGGVGLYRPFSSFNVFFSLFSLCGFPFLAGFYIKELVVGLVLFVNLNLFSVFCFFFSLLLTAFYSFRLFYFLCFGDFNKLNSLFSYKPSLLSVLVLYFAVFFLGYFLGLYGYLWLNMGSSLFIVFFIFISGIFGLYFFNYFYLYSRFVGLFNYFSNMFYLTYLNFNVSFVFSVGNFFSSLVDKGFYLFSFIGYMDNLFFLGWNQIISGFFFSNWLYLLGLSFFFILIVCVLL
nr:NADH dehydrogenase subunit 5 [Platydemus manokwari]